MFIIGNGTVIFTPTAIKTEIIRVRMVQDCYFWDTTFEMIKVLLLEANIINLRNGPVNSLAALGTKYIIYNF